MKAKWILKDRWCKLEPQIKDAATYTTISGAILPNQEIVDTAMICIMHTWIFTDQYKAW